MPISIPKLNKKILKPIIVALIVAVFGYINLNIPKDTVDEAVDSFLDSGTTEEVSQAENNISESYNVVSIIDGDTLVVDEKGVEVTVRVLGINTPETRYAPSGEECYGNEASVRAKELLSNAVVKLQTDSTQATYDKYDRLLAYVQVVQSENSYDFGSRMIEEGFAREYTYSNAYRNQSLYRNLEITAKNNKVGLWGICDE